MQEHTPSNSTNAQNPTHAPQTPPKTLQNPTPPSPPPSRPLLTTDPQTNADLPPLSPTPLSCAPTRSALAPNALGPPTAPLSPAPGVRPKVGFPVPDSAGVLAAEAREVAFLGREGGVGGGVSLGWRVRRCEGWMRGGRREAMLVGVGEGFGVFARGAGGGAVGLSVRRAVRAS